MTFRLARALATHWGVTEIWHMGMGQGRGPQGDPHNSGRAMDFSGAMTRNGPFFVERDWGDRPVIEHGQRMQEWPETETHTQFRLERPGQSLTPAARFFLEVYKFFTYQASDAPSGRPRTPHIGDAGYIIHPDYPSFGSTPSSGRRAHQEHIHVEVPALNPPLEQPPSES